MWVTKENKWMDAPELSAYINKLTEERDAYKRELIQTLGKVVDCLYWELIPCVKDCDNCEHFWTNDCPTEALTLGLKARLEELHDKS